MTLRRRGRFPSTKGETEGELEAEMPGQQTWVGEKPSMGPPRVVRGSSKAAPDLTGVLREKQAWEARREEKARERLASPRLSVTTIFRMETHDQKGVE